LKGSDNFEYRLTLSNILYTISMCFIIICDSKMKYHLSVSPVPSSSSRLGQCCQSAYCFIFTDGVYVMKHFTYPISTCDNGLGLCLFALLPSDVSCLYFIALFAVRITRDCPRFKDELDLMKFICKDFWMALYRKQVDNLRTNHQVCPVHRLYVYTPQQEIHHKQHLRAYLP